MFRVGHCVDAQSQNVTTPMSWHYLRRWNILQWPCLIAVGGEELPRPLSRAPDLPRYFYGAARSALLPWFQPELLGNHPKAGAGVLSPAKVNHAPSRQWCNNTIAYLNASFRTLKVRDDTEFTIRSVFYQHSMHLACGWTPFTNKESLSFTLLADCCFSENVC